MIEVKLSVDVLSRARFGYSPLAELAGSARLLGTRTVPAPHQPWYRSVRDALRDVDLGAVHAVYPPGPLLADLLGAVVPTPKTTIEQQLGAVAELPASRIREELEAVWAGRQMPLAARQLIADGATASLRLAEALDGYWRVALQPHWSRIRSILDDDVSQRAVRLTTEGLHGLLSNLHPELSLRGETLCIDKPHHGHHVYRASMLALVPSVFVWPRLILAHPPGTAILTYGARGVGRLWDEAGDTRQRHDGLGALLGRGRAAILLHIAVPTSTTQLAAQLGQSAPSVSQHLSVLRRSGLVTARRSGRHVLYQRTALAAMLSAKMGSPRAARTQETRPAGLLLSPV